MEHIVYVFDGFHLDVTRRRLSSSGGVVLPLSSRAMDCLLQLVANAGSLVEKRRLMETVWPAAVVEDNNLNQCILAVRKTLGETAGSNRYIMTVPGRGYCFVCPVRRTINSDPAPVPRPSWRHRLAFAAAALPAVLLLLLGVLQAPDTPRVATDDRIGEPSLVLRLRSARDAGSVRDARTSPSALANCLATDPGLRLEVSVRLVHEGADRALWSGRYEAGREDLLSLEEPADVTGSSCDSITSR